MLNIQPVIPIGLTDNWNLITRTIMPVLYIEDLSDGQTTLGIGDGNTWGLGDINFTGYVSPANPGRVIRGVGPSLSVPSATDDLLGSRKWSGGLGAVALAMPKPWTLGVRVRRKISNFRTHSIYRGTGGRRYSRSGSIICYCLRPGRL